MECVLHTMNKHSLKVMVADKADREFLMMLFFRNTVRLLHARMICLDMAPPKKVKQKP